MKTLNPFDYPKPYREALAVHEGLRKLGFQPEDIYFQVGGHVPTVGFQICMVLLDGELRFTVVTGFIEAEPTTIEQTWTTIATAVAERRVDGELLNKLWCESEPHNDALSFVMAIANKGIVIPCARDEWLRRLN